MYIIQDTCSITDNKHTEGKFVSPHLPLQPSSFFSITIMAWPPSPVCLPVSGNPRWSSVVVCSILIEGLEVPYMGHLGDRWTGVWKVVFHCILLCDDEEVYSSLWTPYEKSPVQMLFGSDLLWWIMVSIDPQLRVSSRGAVISGSVLFSCNLF